MVVTYVILALFASFWGVELYAHVTKYRYGRTLSALIWLAMRNRKWGALVRVVIGLLVAILFTHLEFQLP